MRIDPGKTDDPALLAAEIRRLGAALDDATAEVTRLRVEVARLRMAPTLTDAEREALERLCEAVTEYAADDRRMNGEVWAAGDEAAVAVVRGFLARLGGER